MDRKEKVLSYIKSDSYVPLKADELKMVLDVPEKDADKFAVVLDELCCEGRIFLSKRGRYTATKRNLISGRLDCNVRGGFGFVRTDDKYEADLFIPEEHMGGALHGDRVFAAPAGRKTRIGAPIGKIVKVVERSDKMIIGALETDKNGGFILIPDNKAIFTVFHVSEDNSADAVDGDRVSAKIINFEENGMLSARVVANLGESHTLKSFIDGRILESGVRSTFGEAVQREVEAFPKKTGEENTFDISDRLDLRDKTIFTIDGDDARDFDDAVSAEALEDGGVRIGVHIADVTYYVKENSACDAEAFERGTSIYLADRVIPMLPERLSNGLCSLMPKADRLTLSLFMDVNENGEITGHSLHKSVIRSCERLTYDNINRLIEEGDSELAERYSQIYPTIMLMDTTAKKLLQKRIERGAVEFDFPEAKIIMSNSGKPKEVVSEYRGAANQLIEEFMLAANETIAELAVKEKLPFVYRVHEAPSEEKLTAFRRFISNFGISIDSGLADEEPEPKVFQKILNDVHGTVEERLISKTMLRSLMKAEYSSECIGHFGLAAKYYCHFTSPIRRYPDLMVHRILKYYLDGGIDELKSAELSKNVKSAAKVSTDREISAAMLENECDSIMKAYYMMQFLGCEFKGVISHIAEHGIFVELPNTIEGFVRADMITDDSYIYDEDTMTMTGQRFGRIYKIGDEVDVTLVSSDYTSGRVDFVFTGDMTYEKWHKYKALRDEVEFARERSAKRRKNNSAISNNAGRRNKFRKNVRRRAVDKKTVKS